MLFFPYTVAALHCVKRNPHSLLSAGKFFNWLDILLPDFPRDQIRADEITSGIQLILTYLSLMWENSERVKKRKKKILVAACLPGTLCLIALLLTKCWCNYEKQALFLFLLVRFMSSSWGQVMKSQNIHSIPALLLSFFSYRRLRHLCSCALHITTQSATMMQHCQERAARSPEFV